MSATPARPLAHFAAIGLVLFTFERWRDSSQVEPRPEVVIPPTRLAQLAADARREGRTEPDSTALVERAALEEILYREAVQRGLDRGEQSVRARLVEKMRFLGDGKDSGDGECNGDFRDDSGAADAGSRLVSGEITGVERAAPTGEADDDLLRQAVALGLDRDDPIVRGILVSKMRFLLKRSASEGAPADSELESHLERHPERYLQPARVSFRHVFLSSDRRGGSLERDARHLLHQLHDTSPDDATQVGDSFPFGPALRDQSAHGLTRIFGADFAREIAAFGPGAWGGPVRSAYGLHLVWIEASEPARMPPLAAIRTRAQAEVIEKRRQERLEAEVRALRAQYTVRVATGG